MDAKTIEKGISLIICCYNSSWVIRETLEYLFSQRFTKDISWEIIVVNNVSTDNTESVVREVFANQKAVQNCGLKIVFEEKPGLIHARDRGIAESQYEYLLYCDDDNFLSENYLQGIFDIMESDTNIGACGGKGVALIRDCERPQWFDKYESGYAIGSQVLSGEIDRLYGAGICIRKSALIKLRSIVPESILTGRKGDILLSGDDTELTLSLRLLGYSLYATDDISFQHLLPAKRLTIEYLAKMNYGFGYALSVLYYYGRAVEKMNGHKSIRSYFKNCVLFVVKRILSYIKISLFNKKEDRLIKRSYLSGFFRGTYDLRQEVKQCRSIIKKLNEYRVNNSL
jgi:glycosyltransferase involved in cell wall biosynthesis